MIRTCSVWTAAGFDPYENLAAEQTLLEGVGEGEILLYLWQNARTVVIGRNQNPWKECRTALLAEEGGHLARRLSGGGAVFHDLGNLNFTFLMREEDYDLSRQLSVIERACRSLGIPVERSGRNDLLADGRKFSGNAFYKHNGRAYHHGTLMVDVDLEMVQRYLSPSKAKLAAKGVNSVRSRVVNLKEFVPDLTIDALKTALISAFAAVYAVGAHTVRPPSATGNRGWDEAVGAAIGRPPARTGNRQQAIGNRGWDGEPVGAVTGRPPARTGNRQQAIGNRGRDGEPVGEVTGRPPAGTGNRQQAIGNRGRDGEPVGAVTGRPPAGTGNRQQAIGNRGREDEAAGAQIVRPPEELVEKYASDAWLYGQKLPFTLSVEDRFPWGGIEIQLDVNEGLIRAAKVYTDAMDETLAPKIECALSGSALRSEALSERINRTDLPERQKEDLLALLRKAL